MWQFKVHTTKVYMLAPNTSMLATWPLLLNALGAKAKAVRVKMITEFTTPFKIQPATRVHVKRTLEVPC